jgi:hypothetical protein
MDSAEWDVDTEEDVSEFDSEYYGKLLDKAWDEVAFVLEYAIGGKAQLNHFCTS